MNKFDLDVTNEFVIPYYDPIQSKYRSNNHIEEQNRKINEIDDFIHSTLDNYFCEIIKNNSLNLNSYTLEEHMSYMLIDKVSYKIKIWFKYRIKKLYDIRVHIYKDFLIEFNYEDFINEPDINKIIIKIVEKNKDLKEFLEGVEQMKQNKFSINLAENDIKFTLLKNDKIITDLLKI